MLKAIGVSAEGKREVLGVSVSLSEHEVHWSTFLKGLVARGLTGVQLIVSDAHGGLKAARQAVFGAVPWQCCQFHLQQNAQAYVPQRHWRSEVAADIRNVFNAPNWLEAERLLQQLVEKYTEGAPGLAQWLEENLPEGLTVFNYPAHHRRRLRTANSMERLNREVRRRS